MERLVQYSRNLPFLKKPWRKRIEYSRTFSTLVGELPVEQVDTKNFHLLYTFVLSHDVQYDKSVVNDSKTTQTHKIQYHLWSKRISF